MRSSNGEYKSCNKRHGSCIRRCCCASPAAGGGRQAQRVPPTNCFGGWLVSCTTLRMALVTTQSTTKLIGLAINVHRALGPGLFESIYQPCVAHEMRKAGMRFEQQKLIPVVYDGLKFDRAFRADLIVEDELIVEIKSIERLMPVHDTQLLTYMKLSGLRKGLIINFNVSVLKDGLRSIVR
jgi:GxxExxY protein